MNYPGTIPVSTVYCRGDPHVSPGLPRRSHEGAVISPLGWCLEVLQLRAPESSQEEPRDQTSDMCKEPSPSENVQTSDEYDQDDASDSGISPHYAVDCA